ncbi:MAG: hypothetical protein QOD99_612 [Chthoniobacter sp.]|nr:hypothetical protein [Chthoniobacter sp.]
MSSLRRSLAILCWFGFSFFAVRAGELKVDINRDGSKNLDSATATGYTKWNPAMVGYSTSGTAVTSGTFTSVTGETVTIEFSQTALSASRGGTGLLTNSYGVGVSGTSTARLISDGFTVAPATLATGGEIQMTITGLAAGHHTLLTFHNHWDALAPGSLGPINIYVNGSLAVTGLQPTIRAETDSKAPVAYLEFDVASSATVTTILFSAETNTAASVTIKDPVIDGFELDTPNSTRVANTPAPGDADEHVDADNGTAALSWVTATGGSAVSHDVYFGTSLAAVKNATHASAEFKGNQTTLSYAVGGIKSALTYYWRIDEIDSAGNPSKGTVWYFRPRHLAFPGAEGYGRFARGGRGGVVVEVTNLNDTGLGSLRDALTGNYGPRTVVFTVSGLIPLASDLTISQPYITFAGQTAPGKGICTRDHPLGMSGGVDVIIRNIRSRPGKVAGTSYTTNGSGMAGSNHCIMDHCSISWGVDEEMSTRSSKNVTLQRVLISEALNVADHQNYPAGTAHGYAASIGGDIGSFHHNLLAHNEGRNWSLAGGLDAAGFFAGRLDIFNNVVYNWDHRTTDGGAKEVNFVNNYYKTGPSTEFFYALNAQYDNFPGTQRYYIAGNVMPGHFTESQNTLNVAYKQTASTGATLPANQTPPYQNFMTVPFFSSAATIHSASDAFKNVLSDVGCNQPFLDDHDVRMVKETLNGTYTYVGSVSGKPGLPDNQNDVGGWENYFQLARSATWDSDHDGLPDWWEALFSLNPTSAVGDFSDSNSDPDNDGYTALDAYVNWMAEPHAATAPGVPVSIDLAPLGAGFSPATYGVSGATGGTVALLADNHTALFTPAAGFTGLAAFSATITGGGTSMARNVGICVSNQATAAFERRWKGGASSNVWDSSAGNWINGSMTGGYQSSNAVIFDDAGAANPNVVLSGTLQPGGVVVNGSTNYTFSGSGSLAGAMSLVKSGSGALTIDGSHNFSGSTQVQGGSLIINGALNGTTVTVQSGATLSGIGSLGGSVNVQAGGTVSLTSGNFSVTGNVTNNGTIRLTGGAGLNVSGAFVNEGIVDIMTGKQTLPAGFINHGTVLDSSIVRISTATKTGPTLTLTIQGHNGHNYQLQRSDKPGGAWIPVGQAQTGSESVLTFTDTNSTDSQKYYRINLAP